MARLTGAGGILILVFAVAGCDRVVIGNNVQTVVPPSAATSATTSSAPPKDLLYGRVTTDDGAAYEGRLRWGGSEEALWGNYFNGFKEKNPWAAQAPLDQLPTQPHSIQVFGVQLGSWDTRLSVGRPFMARFGDIALIEPRDRDINVTLKSGTVFVLDRYAADDLADGVRVWDSRAGVVDIGEWDIRTIELFSATNSAADSHLLHGTVHTRRGDFTGFLQWDREECIGTDELAGRTVEGDVKLRFDSIRSVARTSGAISEVTLLDGRKIVLSNARKSGDGNRGVYVDDARYGRVLVSWDAFERVDFSPAAAGPAYGDFPAGQPLTGSVVTRSGRRLAGRLVYDLDESEITETLDAPADGISYTIPFGLITAIVPGVPGAGPGSDERSARVTLHSGEQLQLERTGDLGNGNGGLLIFAEGSQRPEYVSWDDVAQITFDRPVETYPAIGRFQKP